VLILFVYAAKGTTSYTVSDAAGLAWHVRSIGGSPPAAYATYYAVAPNALSSDSIRATFSTSGPETLQMMALGVAGANTTMIWDSGAPNECYNRGKVASAGTLSCPIATNNPNDLLIGFAEEVQSGGLTAGLGYTEITSASASGMGAVEARIVSSTDIYSIPWTNSATSAQSIYVTGDAIMRAGGPAPPWQLSVASSQANQYEAYRFMMGFVLLVATGFISLLAASLRPMLLTLRETHTPKRAFKRMLEVARGLSAGTDFVRVDLYNVSGRVLFGELTNYTINGRMKFEPPEWDLKLGNYWM
jgi:hypothetical protein